MYHFNVLKEFFPAYDATDDDNAEIKNKSKYFLQESVD